MLCPPNASRPKIELAAKAKSARTVKNTVTAGRGCAGTTDYQSVMLGRAAIAIGE
jgi:hypothetical protein